MAIDYRETSREAWESFLPLSAVLDRLIMGCLDLAGPGGLTCDAIELDLGRSHQAVSGNLRHLVEKRLVVESGHYGKTRTGRRAIKWVARKYAPLGPQQELF